MMIVIIIFLCGIGYPMRWSWENVKQARNYFPKWKSFTRNVTFLSLEKRTSSRLTRSWHALSKQNISKTIFFKCNLHHRLGKEKLRQKTYRITLPGHRLSVHKSQRAVLSVFRNVNWVRPPQLWTAGPSCVRVSRLLPAILSLQNGRVSCPTRPGKGLVFVAHGTQYKRTEVCLARPIKTVLQLPGMFRGNHA